MTDSKSPRVFEIRFETALELENAYRGQISKGGYFVPSDDPAPRTTPVQVRFYLPGLSDPLVVPGEVAYAATPEAPMPGLGPGMAIQFQELTPQLTKAFEASITIARAEGMGDEPPDDPQETASNEDQEPTEWEGDEEDEEDETDEEETEQDEASAARVIARLNMQSGENLYFTIRQLPMHQKITAAKRGNRTVRNILLQEGNKKIMRFLLQNPQMSVPEIIIILKMPNAAQEIIQAIAKNSSWNQSEEVKFQIVVHPKTPLPLALNLLTTLNVNSLAKLAKSFAVKNQIKSNALRLLEQRRKNS